MASQAPTCAGVGAAKLPLNQSLVAGEKRARRSPFVMTNPACHLCLGAPARPGQANEECYRSLRRNASAANTTNATASRIDVSTGHSTAASLPAASAAGWAASAAGEYVPKGFQIAAIDISAYAASPAPAAPAAELMS